MTGAMRQFSDALALGRGLPRALVRLFAADGPFARYPGPAAVVDGKGRVLAANGKAGEMLADAARGETKLGLALHEALMEGMPAAAAVVVPETQAMVTVTILPAGGASAGTGPAEAALLLGQDMTLMRNLRAVLTESRQRYKDLVEISSDFAWETDAGGKLVFVSPRGALGFRAEDMVGRDPGTLFGLESSDESALSFVTKTLCEDVTVWARRADGAHACLLVSSVPVISEAGEWRGARGVARDVTEARERDAALARANAREQLLAYIVRQIRDEIAPQNMMNAAAATIGKGFGAAGCRIYRALRDGGFTLAAEYGAVPEAPEAPLSSLSPGADRCRGKGTDHFVLAIATRYRHAVNGAISLWREIGARDFDSDDLALLSEVANQMGIAIEQLANHEELERISSTDTLTGLVNRRLFIEEMGRRLGDTERRRRTGALLYLDLDNFKCINDNLGHHRGDIALVAVADVLRSKVREDDVVARLGGDEFAVWLEDASTDEAVTKARELLAATGELAQHSVDSEHALGFSIGVAILEAEAPERLDQLMARADDAMYAVKRAAKGGVQVALPASQPPCAAGGTQR